MNFGAYLFETIEPTEEFLEANTLLKLRLAELEQARQAVIEANRHLDTVIIKELKNKSLKCHEGQLINVSDLNRIYRIYRYNQGDFCALVPPDKISIENLP